MSLRVAEIELALWRRAGKQARLWWRDDDARTPTSALDRLLRAAAAQDMPLTLAVVPDGEPDRVAALAAAHKGVTIAQHGTDHVNRALPGQPLNEVAATDSVEDIAARIEIGARRLRGLPTLLSLYVPPFNQIGAPLLEALNSHGFEAVSGWGSFAQRQNGLARVDTHIETLRWKSGVRFKGAWKFTTKFASELRKRRRVGAWDEPLGFLTHHLDHDEASWVFLDHFLRRVRREPALTMIDARAVFSAPALRGKTFARSART